MLKNVTRLFAVMLFIVSGSSAFAAGLTEQQKIDALLDRLGTSGVTFIRHDKEYDSATAEKFFTQKIKDSDVKITTAKDFITKIGTEGQKTHKPFYIKLKDGTKETSAKWFNDQLAIIEKAAAKK
jgi:hypothetical protein